MSITFQDISIIGVDEDASRRSGTLHTALFDISLKLSASVPTDWCDYFNKRWSERLYMNKRRAQACGSRIAITCAPAELHTDHIPELNAVIAETNTAYRAHYERQRKVEEERRQRELGDKAVLRGLGNIFKE